MELKGVLTALVTPFTKEGDLAEERLRELVDFQIEEGISGLVPMGTTGESPTLTHDEHNKVVELVVEQARGRVPIMAGTGSNSTSEAIKMTKFAKECGADASLQITPYYNKPSQEGLYRHFAAIADAVDIPIVVYNIKSRTGINVENDTMLRLAKIDNIVGVKEASGDIEQIMNLIMRKPGDFAVLSGDDSMGVPMITLGGSGIVSVAGNIIPAEMEEMTTAALDGDIEKARMMHYRYLPLFKSLFIETNPIPVKLALSLMGKIEESYRLPIYNMGDENREKLIRALNEAGIL